MPIQICNIMGSVVVRQRQNNDYSYYVYYYDGKRIEIYCGSTDDPNTQKKLWECEFNELSKQEIIIKKRLIFLDKKIK